MGICGTAMGNTALLLREQGHDVMGADSGIYPPMSDVLADAGIEVFDGFDAERLAHLKPDQIVIGNAMSRGNTEVEWALNQSSIPYRSLPQLFHDSILPKRVPVVVAGTHGKTTTSSIAAHLLRASGAEPGWMIGGVPRDLPAGSSLGSGGPFVIEGDEYDSAFFDKRSKFIHYRPQVAVLNNLEFDHADIFRDLDDVKRTFRHFLAIIPGDGHALINGDDPHLAELTPVTWTNCHFVGVGAENDLQIKNFTDRPEGARFDLIWKGRHWATIEWGMHGLFNARNAAMAALAAAFASGMSNPLDFNLSALDRFGGVARRQDVLAEQGAWSVLEDFAHHPTAVAGALDALRSAHPKRSLYACFEPRSNTAATSVFQSEFTEAMRRADRVYLGAVHRAERIPEERRLNTRKMAEEIGAAQAFESNAELANALRTTIQGNPEGGLIVFFSNGAFDGIQHEIAHYVAGRG